MSLVPDESKITEMARGLLEPYFSGGSVEEYSDTFSGTIFEHLSLDQLTGKGLILDAELKPIAICSDVNTAHILAIMINYACDHRPFQHPEDPTIVNVGL